MANSFKNKKKLYCKGKGELVKNLLEDKPANQLKKRNVVVLLLLCQFS